jgi:hypothetical protein
MASPLHPAGPTGLWFAIPAIAGAMPIARKNSRCFFLSPKLLVFQWFRCVLVGKANLGINAQLSWYAAVACTHRVLVPRSTTSFERIH